MKHYSPTGRRNHSRPLKRLLDMWDRNGSTSGPTPWQIYDDDDLLCNLESGEGWIKCKKYNICAHKECAGIGDDDNDEQKYVCECC
jgi:hypothetical protein